LNPLVLVMHGGGGTAKGLYRDTAKSFTALADAHRFYLVFPDAGRRMWDFGTDKVSRKLRRRFDDERFFKRLLEHLATDLPLDRRRVFATGISRGGQASYFLACKFPSQIRAIAPIAMPMPEFLVSDCAPGSHIGLVVLNGTSDPVVPCEGGEIVALGQRRGTVLSTANTIARWRGWNRCSETPVSRVAIDTASDRASVERFDWQHCDGAPVRLYKIENGGHTWPSGSQYLPRRVVGSVTRDIDGAVEVWDFFSGFK